MKKKLFVLSVLTVLLVSVLTGCGEKTECELCGEEKKCKTVTVLGEEAHVCKDCINEIEEFAEEGF